MLMSPYTNIEAESKLLEDCNKQSLRITRMHSSWCGCAAILTDLLSTWGQGATLQSSLRGGSPSRFNSLLLYTILTEKVHSVYHN